MATAIPLLRLPPELILRISTHMTTPELGYFRRACKQVENDLFNSFAREFFTKRQFMIEEPSLEALVGIANHKSLAPFMQASLSPVHSQRDVLIAMGCACDMLVDAFSRLPNLRVVGLRDYAGRGRKRDGKDATWRSYGWTMVAPSNQPIFPGSPYDGRKPLVRSEPELILPLLLYALGKAHAKPRNVEVFLRQVNLPDAAFRVTPQRMQHHAVPVLSGLKTLLLSLDDLDLTHEAYGINPTSSDFKDLKHFLRHTPLLEHLRLNFTSSNEILSRSDRLLRWLSARPTDARDPTIDLKHLTTLDVGMVAIAPDVLLQLITRYTTLTSLAFWKISLCSSNPSGSKMKESWPCFLSKLSKELKHPDNVESMRIGFLTVFTDSPMAIRPSAAVKFAGKISSDPNGETVYEELEDRVSYRKQFGSNVREWLEQLERTVHVPLLHGMNLIGADNVDDSDASDGDSEAEAFWEDEEDDDEDDDDDE